MRIVKSTVHNCLRLEVYVGNQRVALATRALSHKGKDSTWEYKPCIGERAWVCRTFHGTYLDMRNRLKRMRVVTNTAHYLDQPQRCDCGITI